MHPICHSTRVTWFCRGWHAILAHWRLTNWKWEGIFPLHCANQCQTPGKCPSKCPNWSQSRPSGSQNYGSNRRHRSNGRVANGLFGTLGGHDFCARNEFVGSHRSGNIWRNLPIMLFKFSRTQSHPGSRLAQSRNSGCPCRQWFGGQCRIGWSTDNWIFLEKFEM